MSSLIYAVILGAWAAVLIPMWLRRHDESAEARSVDRFSSAMRVLARREPAKRPEQRYVVMPPRDRVAQVTVTGATTPVRPARHAGRAKLAARRRRVLVLLLVVVLVVTGLALFGVVPWVAVGGALGAVVMYVVHLRIQARRMQELERRRRSIAQRLASRERRIGSAERLGAVRRTKEQERSAARAAAAAARVEADRLAAERRAAERRAAAGWEPVPVPLPTYVTKPKAPRPSRRIDVGAPGAWTDGGEPAPVPVEPASFDADANLDGDVDVAGVDEPRRAVND